ncbi:MAG: DUF7033 domain-containing protein [Cytophagales bacterium]
MASAAERLDYVIKNFLLVYHCDSNPDWQINYNCAVENGVLVPDFSGNYFKDRINFDAILVKWIDYKDEKIPLLFAAESNNLPFLATKGKVKFEFDIVSAIFFFLAGWQETVMKTKDTLERFTYQDSIQKRLNISSLPVVNYYFLMLKEALELAFKTQFVNKINAQNSFNAIISHDVDIWKNLWQKELKYAIKNTQILKAIQLIISYLDNNYYKKSFQKIEALQLKYNFDSTYFFLPDTEKYEGFDSADYEIEKPAYKFFIRLLAQKNEIGLHGGFNSSENIDKMQQDKKAIDAVFPVDINRFHFLMFSQKTTLTILKKSSIKIDSTLGFNDLPGFRNSTSFPFYLFDYEQNTASEVIEMPLIIMDATLFYSHYLHCQSKEAAWQMIEPILKHLQKSGGNLVINWHNDAFAGLGREIWVDTFEQILAYCHSNNTRFCSFEQVYKKLHGI